MAKDELLISAGTADIWHSGRGTGGMVQSKADGNFSDMVGRPLTPQSVLEIVERGLGIVKTPIKKCSHCGQWGAAFCACRSCGAPIDP